MIKSVRLTIPLYDHKPYQIGDVISYQESFHEVISILNFYLERKEEEFSLVVDYVCQDLKYESSNKIKVVDRLTPVLRPFEVSFLPNDTDAYEKFRLGRGFHHRGGYYQILRYTNVETREKKICVMFEALPIEQLPQYHVKKRFKKEQREQLQVIR